MYASETRISALCIMLAEAGKMEPEAGHRYADNALLEIFTNAGHPEVKALFDKVNWPADDVTGKID